MAVLAPLLLQLACRPTTKTAASVGSSGGLASVPTRDLSLDEAAGGHTLRKHVGRTDKELETRLRQERNISAASTYTDRATAEKVVGMVLQQAHERIGRWLERSGGHPNLVLDYEGDAAHPIGRTLRRGESAQPCSHAVVVLRWAGGGEYYVLTTYPECR
jgi:Bacterial CdiA-CT RNAse A domain